MRFYFALIGLVVFCGSARAQDMVEVQSLDFGTFAIINNSAQQTITVQPNGVTAYDSDIVFDIEAERGHYTFTGLPPNVTFTLGISVSNPPTDGGLIIDNPTPVTGGGEAFQLLNFTANTANELITDGGGNATLYIGATLRTSGNGGAYSDGVHSGTYDITFYY